QQTIVSKDRGALWIKALWGNRQILHEKYDYP
ncbi:hypothetical protein HMPREF0989_05013, partial [Ralstonia sp. 5_2_56FAA]